MDLAERFWLRNYPPGVPQDIDPESYPSLLALIEESLAAYGPRIAYRCLGAQLRYVDLDRHSAALAAWLQSQGVAPGDRVAVMLPNVLQFPVALIAALRVGAIVVNVNPLYTAPELAFQLSDAGASVLFVLENFAHTAEAVLDRLPGLRVVVCTMGDMFPGPKGWVVNAVVRHVQRRVRPYPRLRRTAFRYRAVLGLGQRLKLRPVLPQARDIALLQYTGGTTGVAKGAMLLHRNLVANVLQAEAWYRPALARALAGEQIALVTALPLYHIYALMCCALLGLRIGGCCLLIPNPRDVPALVAALRRQRFHLFAGVNTLFNLLLNNDAFRALDFSALILSGGGGMTVQRVVAERWLELTGCPICEGYGLSETSPLATCNPSDSTRFTGTIGLPVPSTEIAILDDAGQHLPPGSCGEIAIRGPQVMAGYWNRPDETAKALTADGFLRTGDIGTMDAAGYTRIVDRKKDMILVSGFNVYPNEIEELVAAHPGVLECAAVGIADAHSGEAVKLYVVRKDPQLDSAALAAYCHERLTGYKLPRVIEFRDELPKSAVGKILRRQLRQ